MCTMYTLFMAFCAKGKCKLTKTSKSGLPQCSTCGRVDLTSKGKTTKKKTTRRTSSSTKSGYSPMPGNAFMESFASRKRKQDAARANKGVN